MFGCCWCCAALRPRYKRLVDNIFPVNPQDGLIKNNMEKLTFYSLSSPEKLDRIGEYLFQRASRDIYRRRNGFVVIAMEAMDQLLVACHAQTLNLFVESFLKMVQKLLESTDPQLQILATQSFVRFANIEEDTPSYHTRYDFFVSKYSAMCHSNNDDPITRKQIRLAGIQGLQGVVRKTLSDDLVENIWEPVHMDKIVPSLLYNMQNSRYADKEDTTPDSPTEERSDPPQFAETCMRELIGRASFGHIRCVIRPVLRSYKTIKENNTKSSTGRERVSWEYYEIFNDIFANDRTINHGPTLESTLTSCVSSPGISNLSCQPETIENDQNLENVSTLNNLENTSILNTNLVANVLTSSSPSILNEENVQCIAGTSVRPLSSCSTSTISGHNSRLLSEKRSKKLLYNLRKKQLEIEEKRVEAILRMKDSLDESNAIQRERNDLIRQLFASESCQK
ncbi:PREDICTED: protein EFR3 homolog B-like [Cyphomyrmex costatus]|uniref:protein EFR3 homolog B-like n=1 Tax=Cyphomyrmex costatus TaxID=456900 RepID=UPI00085235BE|nr:PREDICTED: protein EFR3 homolog B-like [Cyphomyrmex costatus]